jgi:hypothetical protein
MSTPRDATRRTCITLKSCQLSALKGLSRETGAPVAELTRLAVDAFLMAQAAGDNRKSAQVESGPREVPTTSRSTDTLLR